MRLVVNGTVVHTANDPALSIDRRGVLTDGGVVYGIENTWTISGRLEGGNQAAISTAIDQLEDVYSQTIETVALQLDNGNDSSHVLSASDTIGGIRIIKPPHYLSGTGAEYATFRTYEIVIQAIVETATTFEAEIVEYDETVTFRGGGTRDVILTPIIGSPVRFQTAQRTPVFATQRGTIVSLRRHILSVAPLWPTLEFRHLRAFSTGTPRLRNAFGKDFLYPSSWRFEFGAVRVLPVRGPSTLS